MENPRAKIPGFGLLLSNTYNLKCQIALPPSIPSQKNAGIFRVQIALDIRCILLPASQIGTAPFFLKARRE